MTINITAARAVADPAEGLLPARVEIEVEPEHVFWALTSEEITAWWVRPGVFDTREWSGDVCVWPLASSRRKQRTAVCTGGRVPRNRTTA